MVPDLRTLFLVIAVLCAVQGVGMVVLWALNRSIPGIGFWAASNVLNAFTMALLPLQGVSENTLLSTLIPNFCGVTAAAFYYAGCSRFLGDDSWKRPTAIAAALWTVAYLYFFFISDSLQARVYLTSLVLIFFNGVTGVKLIRKRRGGMRFSMHFTGILFLLFTAVLVARLVRTVEVRPPVAIFDGSTAHWVLFLAVAVFGYLRAFGTILMINQRQTSELEERHAAQRRMEGELAAARQDAEEQRALRQRQALVRDLHDGIGGITANLAMLAALGREEEKEAVRHETLKQIQDIALEGNRELRSLMNTLDRGNFQWSDWLAELREYSCKVTEPHGIRMTWEIRGTVTEAPITEPVAAISLARAVKEAVHNITRHSRATEARIELDFRQHQLEIRVSDNGRGLPVPLSGGRGLKNMTRRAEELGGRLTVSGDCGTILHFTLPLPLQYPHADLTAS